MIACVALVLPCAARASYECLNVIPATMVSTLSSKAAFPGERFRFKTTAANIVRGVRIPVGTTGWGIVGYAAAASNHSRNGAIALQPRYLVVGSKIIQVMQDPRESPIQTHNVTVAEKSVSFIPIIGLVKNAANILRFGTEITVGKGFAFHLVAIGNLADVSPCAVVK